MLSSASFTISWLLVIIGRGSRNTKTKAIIFDRKKGNSCQLTHLATHDHKTHKLVITLDKKKNSTPSHPDHFKRVIMELKLKKLHSKLTISTEPVLIYTNIQTINVKRLFSTLNCSQFHDYDNKILNVENTNQ